MALLPFLCCLHKNFFLSSDIRIIFNSFQLTITKYNNIIIIISQQTKKNMPRVTFKTVDETHDIRLIETRQELSQQDLYDRWYNCQETKAMTEQARVIIEFVKNQGIASNLVRIGSEMEILDLRGLELALDVFRQKKNFVVRKLILHYHNSNKKNSIGLSRFASKATASAKSLASEAAWDDANVAKKDCIEYFHRMREELVKRDFVRYGPYMTKRKCCFSLAVKENSLNSSCKRMKTGHFLTRSE